MRKFILFILVIIAVWMLWASLGRSIELKDPDVSLDLIEAIITDSSCTRNVVAIQPYMFTEDYVSEGHFYEKLKAYFEVASKAGYFGARTVVLLPEYVGTWLVISGEKSSVSEIGHINGAMTIMILSNPLKFVRAYFRNQKEEDAIGASLFRMKALEMARIYSEVFKELSSTYKVTIVAGSIILPGPSVDDNQINVDVNQPLFNTSFIFNSNGAIEKQIVKKSFPISSELPFVEAYPIERLPIFDLPIGKTAVLVCADSWYPKSYEQIKGAEVVLVNSFCTGNNTMTKMWQGYDGNDNPSDINPEHINHITESEAWIKYALPGRIKESEARIGVNVFLRGALWDLGADGQPFLIKNGMLLDVGKADRAGIWNFCF